MITRSIVAAIAAAGRCGRSTAPAPERAIAAYVDAHNGEALALLERVVNINSGTQNFAGVREVGAIFRAEFDALGFKTRVGGRRARSSAPDISSPSIRGTGPKILLIGHLDTVFERDSPFQKFQRIDANDRQGARHHRHEGRRRHHPAGARRRSRPPAC